MCPHTENSLVPVLFGLERDIFLYHAGPFVTMGGTAASVSTLLIVVGIPNTPNAAGNGGLMRGFPRDRKSTRLNSSHSQISYAVFCLKKKKSPRTTSWLNSLLATTTASTSSSSTLT